MSTIAENIKMSNINTNSNTQNDVEKANKTNNNTNFISENPICVCGTTILCCLIGLLLFLILLPLSFVGVEYDEYAVLRSTISQTIDWSRVYENGNYYASPGNVAFTFPRTFIPIRLQNQSVIASNGLPIVLDMMVWYKLNGSVDELKMLFENHGTIGYHDHVTKKSMNIIRDNMKNFSTDQFLTDHELIKNSIEVKLRDSFVSDGIIIGNGLFFMLNIKFPATIINNFLQTAIQNQKKITAEYEIDQSNIMKNTQLEVNKLLNEAEFIRVTTDSKIQSMIEKAEATASNIIQTTEGKGISAFLTNIPITSPSHISKVMQVKAYSNHDAQYFVGSGFNVYVGGKQ